MPDTGLFHIVAFDADHREDHSISRVNALTIRCHQCGKLTAWNADNLQRLEGGTILACRHCQNRQAISNARLNEGPVASLSSNERLASGASRGKAWLRHRPSP